MIYCVGFLLLTLRVHGVASQSGIGRQTVSGGTGGGGIAGLATVATIAKPPAEETAVEEFVATDAPSQSEAAPAPAES